VSARDYHTTVANFADLISVLPAALAYDEVYDGNTGGHGYPQLA